MIELLVVLGLWVVTCAFILQVILDVWDQTKDK